MPGVFRPYTLTDVLGSIADAAGAQSQDTTVSGVGYFAEADENVAPTLAYRTTPATSQSSGSVTSFSVTKQAGTAAGDWIFMYLFGANGSSVACTGFTVTKDASGYGALLYRLADGTEGSSFNITGLGGKPVAVVIATVAVAQDVLDPAVLNTPDYANATTSLAVSSITLTNSDDWVLWFGSNENGYGGAGFAITPPAEFTSRATNGAQAANPTVLVADNVTLSAGATGAEAGTAASSTYWSGIMVGLTPLTGPNDTVTATVQTPSTWDNGEWGQFTWG